MFQDSVFSDDALELVVRNELKGSNEDHEELAIQILVQSHAKESCNPLLDCRRLVIAYRTSDDPRRARALDVCYVIRPEPDRPKLRQFYDKELDFYSDVVPCLRPHIAPPGFCPELLMHDRDGFCMFFENPQQRGFHRAVKQKWSTSELHAIAKTMARFQAAAWLTDRARGGGRPLHEDHPWLLPRGRRSNEEAEIRGMNRQIRFIERIARDELRQSTKWIRRVIIDGYRLVRDWQDADGRLKMTLAHGRTWCSEILFRSAVEPVAWFRDWNMVRYAPLTLDLVQFVHIRCDRNTRLYGLLQIIKAYHEELERCLLRGGVPQEDIPSREAIHKEFDELRLAGLHYAALYVPTTAIGFEALLRDTLGNDQELLEKLNRLQRADNHADLLKHYRSDEQYQGRINELVLEIVRYGEKHEAREREAKEREERRQWGLFKRLRVWVEDKIVPPRR
ncbi:uncharacterized protein LOC106649158 [Trichogramma pretiosum]|uniref:uncharacterized protein LOC106649158 n=1 Tax=Trichogramma pretiosum TaxID=7493 RepID=UPI0006C97F20|nr:uncharacterized protein LOC106649158 [Trichogramma pretiosum]